MLFIYLFICFPGKEIKDIMKGILKTNTGTSLPVNVDFLLANTSLKEILEDIIKNFGKINFKKIQFFIKEKINETRNEKYQKMKAEDLNELLRMSPFGENRDELKVSVSWMNEATS